ncbi:MULTISPECIES: alpha-(1-_3)-arabinofuranosyltransferase domain-containing protein [unclassified Nocardioides]|uniref:alpha-(1->3)-arabinofuranosyltransferase domain-containing protein n=1 Tax=unclassified Nocardioides TaxID=2615069 RepID=UPI00360E3DE9
MSLAIVAAVVVLNLVQQPGLITFDTKLDLQFDVTGFLSRSLDVWNADWTLGGLQNQASGYLVPMGPAFWLGDAMHVPMWIWERLWTAAVMLIAYFGMLRLARNWPGINAAGAVLAGLTYMLAPRVLTTVGGLSGETLPSAILPWTVLPLVLYLRGRLPAWVAFLWSAATIPWMGGQNATLVVACLILPGLLLLLVAGRSWPRRVRDAVVWTGFALVASLWWIVPLFLMGAYAPPFLGFIESAYNTASQTGWLASFRGTSHWVAFFPGGGSAGWVGGYELASSSVLMVTTVLVAGAGLVGLAQPELWARRVLVLSMLIGLAVLTLGSAEPAGSVLGKEWLAALDSSLAALRNVHKFDPLVRLPLSLGMGAFVAAGVPQLVARARRLPVRRRGLAVAGATAALVVLVGAAAQPAATGDLRTADGVRDISGSWQETVDYLRAQDGPVGVLVLPGTTFAVQTWGRTVDEPIQVLSSQPWASRSQSAVAPAGTLRVLDAIENQIAAGRPITGFAAALRRMGITHVVVRNDLDPEETSAPPIAVVMASVTGSTGLTPVASFGRTSDEYPAVAVLEVEDEGADSRVSIADWDTREVVQGGPEVVNDLAQLDLVRGAQPVVLAGGSDDASDGTVDVVTDSNQRVERSFGRITDGVSGVMTADEDFRLRRPIHDFTGGSVPTATTDAEYKGASLVKASSSGGYADVLGAIRQDEAPYAAFDDSGFTAWTTAPLTSPVDQWIEVEYDEPVDAGTVGLIFDNVGGADVSEVRLTTDGGSVEATVGSDGIAQGIDLPDGTTSSVRMTVLEVRPGARQVRLSNMAIEGGEFHRTLELPGEVTADTTMLFRSEPARRACVFFGLRVSCSASWQRETPETAGFDRTVTVEQGSSWRLEGRAVATNGPSLDRLFAPLDDRQVSVQATSTYAGDPAVVAANAFDGRPETSWYASPFDDNPAIKLSWKRPRTITSVTALLGSDQPGVLPEALVVDPLTEDVEPQLVATTGDQAGAIEPVRTKELLISALPDPQRTVGVGIGELEIDGLEDLRHTTDAVTPTGLLCGFGPTVEVGGRTIETKVVGTIADVVGGAELSVEPCGRDSVHIAAGTQRVRVTSPEGFSISRLWLEPEDSGSGTISADEADARVVSWSSAERTVEVRADQEAVLSVAQSDNPGWEARIDGALLDPVAIDGWKQGWRIPAGTAGKVTLAYTPQASFQWGIVIGLGLAALLSVAALVTLVVSGGRWSRRRRGTRVAAAGHPGPGAVDATAFGPNRLVVVVGAGALALVSLPLCVGAVAGFAARRLPLVALSAACATGLLVAAAAAIVDVGGAVTPPVVANVVTAVVVGLVAGRVLFGDDLPEDDLA